jgi:hypothetical protein
MGYTRYRSTVKLYVATLIQWETYNIATPTKASLRFSLGSKECRVWKEHPLHRPSDAGECDERGAEGLDL